MTLDLSFFVSIFINRYVITALLFMCVYLPLLTHSLNKHLLRAQKVLGWLQQSCQGDRAETELLFSVSQAEASAQAFQSYKCIAFVKYIPRCRKHISKFVSVTEQTTRRMAKLKREGVRSKYIWSIKKRMLKLDCKIQIHN